MLVEHYIAEENLLECFPYNVETQKASTIRLLISAAAYGVLTEWVYEPFTIMYEHGNVSHHVMQNGYPYYVVESSDPEYGYLIPAQEYMGFAETKKAFKKGLLSAKGIIPYNKTLYGKQQGDTLIGTIISNEYLTGRIISMYRESELDNRDDFVQIDLLNEVGVEELSDPSGNIFVVISTSHNKTLVTLRIEDCKPDITKE